MFIDKKGDWLDACIALKVVGVVLVVFLRRRHKICIILQPMGNKGRYLKKCTVPYPVRTNKKKGNLD